MNDDLKALIAKWILRSEEYELALLLIDRQETPGISTPETERLTTQAHQKELERCILEISEILW